MKFTEPIEKGFTVYTKNGCHYCDKLKNLLIKEDFFFYEVNCDNYLIEERDNFLSFIKNKIGKSYTTFPIVFYDGEFIGGYTETEIVINKECLSFEDLF